MNLQHLRALLWLRWRLRVNQLKRGGTLNTVLTAILAVAGVLVALVGFVGFFLLGSRGLSEASPGILLLVWDGMVAAFLFTWVIGVLTELQRGESLSLDRLLHLPVSLTGAFLINYLSSLLSLNLIVFGPFMLGLGLGLVVSRGPDMLLILPLALALLFMVTALTYQFQGWLATLMANPRRRRTVIVFVTAAFILVCQLPNLVNVVRPWEKMREAKPTPLLLEQAELERQRVTKQITDAEYQRRLEAAQEQEKIRSAEERKQAFEHVLGWATMINLVLPPGWLPLSVRAAATGDLWPALAGTLGLALIGAGSLWRAYRTTVHLYTGQYTAEPARPAAEPTRAAQPRPVEPGDKEQRPEKPTLLERDLPGLSEQATAIALASMRGLTRAPEVKMILLTPLILVVVFGSLIVSRPDNMPEQVRPLMACGAMSMILLTMGQLAGNQFGFDRTGFRVYVLCPARRRDILLGKNLSVAPLALGLGVALAGLLQVIRPMRFDHFLAVLCQFVSMYLIYCLLANALSIFAPMPIAAGTLKPRNPKLVPILLHLGFVLLFPVALAPTLLPLGIEILLEQVGWGVPVYLLLSLLGVGVVALLYRLLLDVEGDLLMAREQKILEVVAGKSE
jgi:hypothetical protein